MKVLHAIAIMDPMSGGLCQALRNIIPELNRYGVDSEVVSLDDPGSSFLNKDSFPIMPLGPGKTSWRYSRLLMPWLKDNLNKYDIVIVHGLWQYHGYAVINAIEKLRQKEENGKIARLMVMPHGMLDPYFQKAPERKLKAIRNWIFWKLMESRLINKADAILFTCETELLLARETFKPYSPKKELNVSFGIQLPPEFQQDMTNSFLQKCPLTANRPFILFLSRIHQKKGVDILIKAFEEVFFKGTNVAEIPLLVIAGPGINTKYGQTILEMVDKSEALSANIVFPGMLSGDNKWGAFYNCEAFILPSHQENFGIAVAEALACSKSVLISKEVNIWREIDAMNAGIIAQDNLDGTINLLMDWKKMNTEEREAMGHAALQCFKHNFAIEPATKRLFEKISS